MLIYVKAGSIIPYGAYKNSTCNETRRVHDLGFYVGEDGTLEYEDRYNKFKALLKDKDI